MPVPYGVGRKMLELAGVGPDDVLFDLGCGDGRLLLMAVRDFGARRAVGYEVSPFPYLKALLRAMLWKKARNGRIKIYRRDLFSVDLDQATVVVLYLTEKLLERLKIKLQKELKPGVRIVTARYPINGWREEEKDNSAQFPIWLYRNRNLEK